MKQKELLRLISSRRAVFPAQYNTEKILKEEINRVLEAANWAPTHRRTEPWRFKVFYGDSKRKLGDFLAYKYQTTSTSFSEFKRKKILEKMKQSACIIAICMRRDPSATLPEWEEVASTAMAVQNMWLMAHSMGIGAYWSTPSYMEYLGEHVELQDGERCLGFFYMGKYDGQLPVGERKTSIAEKTIWI